MDNSRISDVFRKRLREVRDERGFTREQLSERLGAVGYPIEPLTLARLETGRIKRVPLDDVVALAYVLGVSPLFLVLPFGRGETVKQGDVTIHMYDETVEVVPGVQPWDHRSLRAWLRGEEPLPGQDVADFYRQLPPDELEERMQAAREVEAGKTTLPGAPALRGWSVEEGTAEPAGRQRLDAIRQQVSELTDEQVLGEFGGDQEDFEESLALRAPTETRREQLRRRELRQLRQALVQHLLEVEAHREALRQRPALPDVLPWKRKEA